MKHLCSTQKTGSTTCVALGSNLLCAQLGQEESLQLVYQLSSLRLQLQIFADVYTLFSCSFVQTPGGLKGGLGTGFKRVELVTEEAKAIMIHFNPAHTCMHITHTHARTLHTRTHAHSHTCMHPQPRGH